MEPKRLVAFQKGRIDTHAAFDSTTGLFIAPDSGTYAFLTRNGTLEVKLLAKGDKVETDVILNDADERFFKSFVESNLKKDEV